ncbi:hypothetical protein BJ508DRAFT_309302 [Ascobolus immersus RN42]|uniref:Uncharacterized protein n=1 Tax=Ascobolus immersus RN42 TaxID=1160509 RepID=A0A3N4I0Y6_ASCIM|nr:hypothetical protein BJ508DRAFT_309302 [Ascobolus immersus RN42]
MPSCPFHSYVPFLCLISFLCIENSYRMLWLSEDPRNLKNSESTPHPVLLFEQHKPTPALVNNHHNRLTSFRSQPPSAAPATTTQVHGNRAQQTNESAKNETNTLHHHGEVRYDQFFICFRTTVESKLIHAFNAKQIRKIQANLQPQGHRTTNRPPISLFLLPQDDRLPANSTSINIFCICQLLDEAQLSLFVNIYGPLLSEFDLGDGLRLDNICPNCLRLLWLPNNGCGNGGKDGWDVTIEGTGESCR